MKQCEMKKKGGITLKDGPKKVSFSTVFSVKAKLPCIGIMAATKRTLRGVSSPLRDDSFWSHGILTIHPTSQRS